ncbi:hypothetical protein, partial [Microcoleus sp. S13_B4]|uniref:hypothetical protein n=1 Tax=Microcoleus sp. S13_B4 TaxID=3055408 RepID=UPI002FD6041E
IFFGNFTSFSILTLLRHIRQSEMHPSLNISIASVLSLRSIIQQTLFNAAQRSYSDSWATNSSSISAQFS